MAVTRSMNRRNWSEMPHEILVYIISLVNILDRINNVAAVCHSWRLAASDKVVSKVLNIVECKKLIKPLTPKKIANLELQLAFVRGINLSGFNLTTLVFDTSFQINNRHLKHASRRCPNLKTLILPFPNSATERGVKNALRIWENLECFNLPYHSDHVPPVRIFKTVGLHCSRLRVLKISCWSFTTRHLQVVSEFMLSLKVLSVRCVELNSRLVEDFSNGIPSLEEVHLSILSTRASSFILPRISEVGLAIINKARNIKRFQSLQMLHVCSWADACHSCVDPTMGGATMNIPYPILCSTSIAFIFD